MQRFLGQLVKEVYCSEFPVADLMFQAKASSFLLSLVLMSTNVLVQCTI